MTLEPPSSGVDNLFFQFFISPFPYDLNSVQQEIRNQCNVMYAKFRFRYKFFGFITPLHFFVVAKLDICLLKLTQLNIFILVETW